MENESIKVQKAKIWLRKEGIIHVEIFPYAELELDDAKEIITVEYKLARGEKVPLLVDMRKSNSITREAREYFSEEKVVGFVTAIAFQIDSPMSRILGNFFIGLHKLPYPAKLFTSETKAIKWLKEF